MKRFILQSVLVCVGLWPVEGLPTSQQGYYLGWAEVVPIEGGIQVSFNPIDCNVCSFAVILPEESGILVAHFDVPLIASADQNSDAKEEKIVARKAEFISKGTVSERPDPPSLVLLREGGLQLTDGSSRRSLRKSDLKLLTADSVIQLTDSRLFERAEVLARRTVEGDPFKVLESFDTPERNSIETNSDTVELIAQKSPEPKEMQGVNRSVDSARIYGFNSLEVPTLSRVWPTNKTVGISGLCHLLLYYGLGPTDLPQFPSGHVALKALTDEPAAIRAFGKSPFIRTRNGLRYLLSNDPVFHSDVGESHQDQCLATFAALDLPLDTAMRVNSQSYSISDLLSESVSNFSFDQKELAWTAIAFAHYLPPKREWVNRFKERTTFSELVQHLLQRNLNSESCAGTHILSALLQIEKADCQHPILDDKNRLQLHTFLEQHLRDIAQRQREDGSWSRQWCASINHDAPRIPPFQMSFLVTGHIAEILDALRPRLRPPGPYLERATGWLTQALISDEIRADGSWLCPFTHACRVVQGASNEAGHRFVHGQATFPLTSRVAGLGAVPEQKQRQH